MAKTAQTKTATELAKHLNETFGAGTAVIASNAYGLVKPRISTGSLALDLISGGGFPEGGIEILEGDEASSKSWNLHTRAAHFLRKFPEGVYILVNAEGTNDPPFLEMLGCDLDRSYFIQPDSGEQAWDVAVEVAKHAKKVYIGIDSLDAMVPLAELEAEMDQAHMAVAARLHNKGFRKLIAVMKSDMESQEHRITLGIITQLRTNIGVMFGDNKASVGGKGKNFAAMMITRLTKKKALKTEGKTVVERMAYALEIEAEVKKNKGIGEGEKVRFRLYKREHEGFKRGQIDNVTELMPFLVLYGIIEQKGAWFYFDGGKCHGEANMVKKLRADDELRESLCEQVVAEVNRQHGYEPPTEENRPKAKSAPAKKKRAAKLPRGTVKKKKKK